MAERVRIANLRGPRGPQGPEGPIGPAADLTPVYETISEHVVDLTPHPAYDDLPDLSLLFENGLA